MAAFRTRESLILFTGLLNDECIDILLKYIIFFLYLPVLSRNIFSTPEPKNIYFLCQMKWLNIFLFKPFSYRQINLTWKENLFKPFTWKILFNSLSNWKRPKNVIITLKSYLKQDNVGPHPILSVSIKFRGKISFDTSFTISNDLKSTIIRWIEKQDR